MNFTDLELLLDLPQISITNLHKTPSHIFIWGEIPEGQHRCPQCGSLHEDGVDFIETKIRDLSVFGKTCYLILRINRLHCSCGYHDLEQIDFLDQPRQQTSRFSHFVQNCVGYAPTGEHSGSLKEQGKTCVLVDVYTS